MTTEIQPEAATYRLVQMLGEGLSSLVYKAVRIDSRQHSSQLVALKILKSENDVQILKSEFAALQSVRSPYCVSVLGWENFPQGAALVLEFVSGATLEALNRFAPLSRELVDEMTAQVQIGLIHLQEKGLCHGDLSPANIIIDESGRARLVDFGLSHCPFRRCHGTPEYLAPERWGGAQPDFASDLFALGIIRQKLIENLAPDSLSVPEPTQRQCLDLMPDPARQEVLGQLVHSYMDSRAPKNVVTQVLLASSSRPIKLLALAVSCVLLFPQMPFGKSTVAETASIKAFANHWVQISVDGREIGYAPLQIAAYPGSYHLRWRTARKSGEITLQLQPGEQKLLGEHDFR